MAEQGSLATAAPSPTRRSQAARRAESHTAILASAARALARYGYSSLNLADVAAEAGYTRGAVYHLFADKEALALAVVGWVWETWEDRVGSLIKPAGPPLTVLVALARAHIAFCRDGQGRVMLTLRVEFSDRSHPVGDEVRKIADGLRERIERIIVRGRRKGSIPPGPPPRALAAGYLSALDGLSIGIAGRTPHDADLAERALLGLLIGR